MTKKERSRDRKGKRGKTWQTYEEVAAYVLRTVGKRFGLSDVEGKQKIRGRRSGTFWVIDAKGVREPEGTFLIIECRRYASSRLTQEALGAIAWRIQDTEAAGGITISPHPLQRGAEKVAKAGNIQHVELDRDSSRDQWIAKIAGIMIIGFTDRVSARITDTLTITVRDNVGNIIEESSL